MSSRSLTQVVVEFSRDILFGIIRAMFMTTCGIMMGSVFTWTFGLGLTAGIGFVVQVLFDNSGIESVSGFGLTFAILLLIFDILALLMMIFGRSTIGEEQNPTDTTLLHQG